MIGENDGGEQITIDHHRKEVQRGKDRCLPTAKVDKDSSLDRSSCNPFFPSRVNSGVRRGGGRTGLENLRGTIAGVSA